MEGWRAGAVSCYGDPTMRLLNVLALLAVACTTYHDTPDGGHPPATNCRQTGCPQGQYCALNNTCQRRTCRQTGCPPNQYCGANGACQLETCQQLACPFGYVCVANGWCAPVAARSTPRRGRGSGRTPPG